MKNEKQSPEDSNQSRKELLRKVKTPSKVEDLTHLDNIPVVELLKELIRRGRKVKLTTYPTTANNEKDRHLFSELAKGRTLEDIIYQDFSDQ